LPLFSFNEECPVSAGHQPALTASLPFVHTARRCYRRRWDKDLRSLVMWGLPARTANSVNIPLLEEAKVVTRLL